MTLAQVHAYGNDRYKQAVGDLLIDLQHWGHDKADLQSKRLVNKRAWDPVLTGVSSISVLPGSVMTHWT